MALDFSNPLELLIALILAAQARDDLVNSVTADVFPKYRTAADWANAKLESLQTQLQRINFYRKKSEAIQKACRVLVERFGGSVPDNLDDLLTLPGVGRKTANIILGNAFGQQAIGVDTHVARLSQRLGLTEETDPDKIEADLVAIVPADRFGQVLPSPAVSRPPGVPGQETQLPRVPGPEAVPENRRRQARKSDAARATFWSAVTCHRFPAVFLRGSLQSDDGSQIEETERKLRE